MLDLQDKRTIESLVNSIEYALEQGYAYVGFDRQYDQYGGDSPIIMCNPLACTFGMPLRSSWGWAEVLDAATTLYAAYAKSRKNYFGIDEIRREVWTHAPAGAKNIGTSRKAQEDLLSYSSAVCGGMAPFWRKMLECFDGALAEDAKFMAESWSKELQLVATTNHDASTDVEAMAAELLRLMGF